MTANATAAKTSQDADAAPFRYAVVDLAVVSALRPVVTRLRASVAEPLFARDAPQKLLNVGPWVVRLSKAPEVADYLTDLGEETPWGYYIAARIDIASLRQTLRRFTLVRLPNAKKEVLFRYWDPRVMAVFLETASNAQLDSLFIAIEQIEGAGDLFEMTRHIR